MTPRRDATLHRVLLAIIFIGVLAMLIWMVRAASTRGRHDRAMSSETGPRIVALSPALAITLRDLGIADRIVGRHGFDMVLDKSIPVCGDQTGVDYEALLRVKPTHVLTEWGSREIPARLKELAGRNGWTLADFTQLKLDDVLENTNRLGVMFCIPDTEGQPVAPMRDALVGRMRDAWTVKHAPINAGRILLLESIDPPAALGPGSFHHQMLERIGGAPAITAGKPYMRLEVEDILRMAPEGIILFAPGAAATSDARAQLGRIGALDIPATRSGHIVIINDPLCLTPSSALLPITEQMERTLKSWQP